LYQLTAGSSSLDSASKLPNDTTPEEGVEAAGDATEISLVATLLLVDVVVVDDDAFIYLSSTCVGGNKLANTDTCNPGPTGSAAFTGATATATGATTGAVPGTSRFFCCFDGARVFRFGYSFHIDK
jgi:hypothetical protein